MYMYVNGKAAASHCVELQTMILAHGAQMCTTYLSIATTHSKRSLADHRIHTTKEKGSLRFCIIHETVSAESTNISWFESKSQIA